MVDLYRVPLKTLLMRAFHELKREDKIFDLPRDKFWRPDPARDTAVEFQGRPAGTPLGPASGPQSQLVPNVVLSWLGGSRIIELKTVQVKDDLVIPRPCIDARTVGFNVEWSQELRVEDSLREYVAAHMMLEILRQEDVLGLGDPARAGAVQLDVSLGYDLAGIRSEKITGFLENLKDCSKILDELRPEIPDFLAKYRDWPFETRIVHNITLSTFHGCPAGEIESIVRYLLVERGIDMVVKMNPTLLGRRRVGEILHDRLGYGDIRLHEVAYERDISFDGAVAMMRRLREAAAAHGRRVGVKFSNTLEVMNDAKDFFSRDEVMYLSGQPLHVITLALAGSWREAVGDEFPISFSAGVDHKNFAGLVRCGFAPITTCTDLLRPGGYGRLVKYMDALTEAMAAAGASNVREFVLAGRGSDLVSAKVENVKQLVAETLENPRFRAEKNAKKPNRIASHLVIFDCVSCDKCIPVCPNDANFYYEVGPVDVEYSDWVVTGGRLVEAPGGRLRVEQSHQIANFADFCNECGNCDTFCPEYGGPFVEKPSFFRTEETWRRHRDHDGFHVGRDGSVDRILGRIQGAEHELVVDRGRGVATYDDGRGRVEVDLAAGRPTALERGVDGHRIRMRYYFLLQTLLAGVLGAGKVHYVNAAYLREGEVG